MIHLAIRKQQTMMLEHKMALQQLVIQHSSIRIHTPPLTTPGPGEEADLLLPPRRFFSSKSLLLSQACMIVLPLAFVAVTGESVAMFSPMSSGNKLRRIRSNKMTIRWVLHGWHVKGSIAALIVLTGSAPNKKGMKRAIRKKSHIKSKNSLRKTHTQTSSRSPFSKSLSSNSLFFRCGIIRWWARITIWEHIPFTESYHIQDECGR